MNVYDGFSSDDNDSDSSDSDDGRPHIPKDPDAQAILKIEACRSQGVHGHRPGQTWDWHHDTITREVQAANLSIDLVSPAPAVVASGSESKEDVGLPVPPPVDLLPDSSNPPQSASWMSEHKVLIGGTATIALVGVGYYVWQKRKQAKKKKKREEQRAQRLAQKGLFEQVTKKAKK